MRYGSAGPLVVALTTLLTMPAVAVAPRISFEDFSNWNFANESGQRALRQGDLRAATKRFRNAIEIAYRVAATDPGPLARSYTDYALLLLLQGRAKDAEPLARWALTVREQRFGKESTQVATTLHVLALLASEQSEYLRAEALLIRAIENWQKQLGPGHPLIAVGLNDLATLYSLQRKYDEAEPIFKKVLESPGADPSDRTISLVGLAALYVARGQFDRAESCDQQLAGQLERMPAMTYRTIAPTLEQYLAQLRKSGRTAQVEALEEAIRTARSGEPVGNPRQRGMQGPPLRIKRRST
jgi:tetratricopeptide (TPR) repeat protein